MKLLGEFEFVFLWKQGGALTLVLILAYLVEDGAQLIIGIKNGFSKRISHFFITFDLAGHLKEIMSGVPKDVFSKRDGTIRGRRYIAVYYCISVRIIHLMRMQQNPFLPKSQLTEKGFCSFLVYRKKVAVTSPIRI